MPDMADLGLVPVLSFRDPALTDASEDHLEMCKDWIWVARTAVKVPTLKTKTAGREMPAYPVKMRYLEVKGPTREVVVAKLREEIVCYARGIPDLVAQDLDV